MVFFTRRFQGKNLKDCVIAHFSCRYLWSMHMCIVFHNFKITVWFCPRSLPFSFEYTCFWNKNGWIWLHLKCGEYNQYKILSVPFHRKQLRTNHMLCTKFCSGVWRRVSWKVAALFEFMVWNKEKILFT